VFAHGRLATNSTEAFDLVLYPPHLPGANLMNWDIHEQVFEAAYHWTLAYLDRAEAEGNPIIAALAPGLSDLNDQWRNAGN
jgi:hypothetical protein